MAVFLRGRPTGSSGKLVSTLVSHGPSGEAPVVRLLVRGSPRLLCHRSLPARTSLPPAQEDHAAAAAAAAGPAPAVETPARQLQEELFRVLCEPRPSMPSLLALVRGIVAAGAEPSAEVVQALADHFSQAKDAKSLKAILSLLKGSKTTAEDLIGMVSSRVIRAHCRRQDVTRALAEVVEMETSGREAGAEVFSVLLDACAMARPPLLREVETVWAHIEERNLTTEGGSVRQDLFIGRMAAHANGAGYAPLGESQEDWQQALLKKVDESWNGMLEALASAPAGGDGTFEEGGVVTAESWIARASALALCARDHGANSDAAMSGSLEALRSYQRCGGSFAGMNEAFALAGVVRGLARCGRQSEAVSILGNPLQASAQSEENGCTATTETTATAVDKATARTAATQAARVPDELLRALGARGRGLDSGGRPYGLALLKVVEDVATEAFARGDRSREDVDSRLTATLQAVLTTSRFLDRGDAAVINKAARVALDSAAAAVIDSEERGDNHAVEDSQGEVAAAGTSRRWPGPNLAALSILTLLHVSQNQREGIPAVVDVLQQMHDRGLSPPPSLAAQLETIFKRHGTVRQKRRSSFLLARALDGFGPPPDDEENAGQEEGAGSGTAVEDWDHGVVGAPRRVVGIGDAMRGMVESSTTRGVGERDAHTPAPAVAAEKFANGGGGGGDGSSAKISDPVDGAGGAPPLSAEARYQLSRQKTREVSLGGSASAGVRSIERACAAAAAGGAKGKREEAGEEQGRFAATTEPETESAESHRDLLRQVTVLAERGRAHAALMALQAVDGRKRGTRAAVPYKVYGLVFRALSIGYSARGVEELELAAAPTEALQWLLRGMARQGYSATTTNLNFGLEAFAVAAKTRKVREGGEEVRAQVCMEAMDFMEEMRDGWNGLLPPVLPNFVSFNIVIKVMCRLQMFDQAFEALEVMERGGFEPDLYTHSTLIHGLARAGDSDGAWEVMVDMTNKGIAPDSIVIDGIVDGFVQKGDVGEAISFAQHAFNQYGCAPTAEKFCRVVHAAAALDDGQHEARRAIVVAEQMWTDEWRGDGKTSHPVLGHANLRRLLKERGAFDQVNRL